MAVVSKRVLFQAAVPLGGTRSSKLGSVDGMGNNVVE
jgi:hypothetical protein